LVGLGAPIHVFLQEVAEILGTQAVIPTHHEVANAVGAVMGSVSATVSIEIKPNVSITDTTGYTVYGNEGAAVFDELSEAETYATHQAETAAKAEAYEHGAAGELTVTVEIKHQEAKARDCIVYLGTTVTAHAAGAVGMEKPSAPTGTLPTPSAEPPKPTETAPIPQKHSQYNTEALIQEALESGFSQAGPLSLNALVFMPEVKAMCATCPQYGKNWRCPPGCGSVEDAAAKAAQYSYGLLVQTIGHMADDFDHATIETTGKNHGKNFSALIEKLKTRYPDILPMGAGTCNLCKTCSYPDAPCRFPHKAMSSMEAYGLWVSKVCTLSGLPYNNGKGSITYTSCYLLK